MPSRPPRPPQHVQLDGRFELRPDRRVRPPEPGRIGSFYGSRHNITFSGNLREEFFQDLATSFGFTFVARAGRPYSLTFTGGSVFNDSASGNDNALVYLPTGISDPNISPSSNMAAVQALSDFASDLGCAKDYLGRSIKRNTCKNDWYYDLDLRISQELPGLGRSWDRRSAFATRSPSMRCSTTS